MKIVLKYIKRSTNVYDTEIDNLVGRIDYHLVVDMADK